MCPSQGVIFQMLAQRFENAVPAMGWKGGGADVGTNLIDGHNSSRNGKNKISEVPTSAPT